MCAREIAVYRSHRDADRLAFTDVAAPGSVVGPGLDRPAAMARFHVRLPDGRLVSGAAAFVAVWRQLRGWRWLARTSDLPGAMTLLEIGYIASLRVRPFLVRRVRRLTLPEQGSS